MRTFWDSWRHLAFPPWRVGQAWRPPQTPVRLQSQTTECGVAALASILAHHGRDMTLDDVRKATGVSRDCLNAANLARAARTLGLACAVRRYEPDRLASLSTPSIVYLNFIHFAVFEGVRGTDILLNDPSRGHRVMAREEFDEAFTGIVLTFAPTRDFRSGRTRPPERCLLRALGCRGAVLITLAVLSTIAGAGAVLWMAGRLAASPAGLPHAGGMLLLPALGVIALALLRGEALAALRQQVADRLEQWLLRHIASCHGAFLAYRIPLSLRDTVCHADSAADLLCKVVLPRWIDLAAVPVLLAGLWTLHSPAALVAGGLLGLHTLASLVLIHWRRAHGAPPNRSLEETFNQLFNDLDSVESWKIGGRERDLLARILGLRAQGMLRTLPHLAPFATAVLLSRLSPLVLTAAVTLMGSQAVASGSLRPEALLSLVLLSGSLAFAIHGLGLLRGQGRHLAALQYRMEDLLTSGRPVSSSPPRPADIEASDDAILCCTSLAHGHRPDAPPLLRDIDLRIMRGEQLGLTGPSGGGKSSLAMILAGLRDPWSGHIKRRGDATTPAWLDKQTVFFEGSLRDNLCLWRSGLADPALWQALRTACLDDEIARRPRELDTPVAVRGRNFSGGQLQRLEIARALLHGYRFLVLDEALDALNPALETRLRENLRQKKCTLVVISHRRSTLAACDRVLTLAQGRLVEPGTPPPAAEPVSGLGETLRPPAQTTPIIPPAAPAGPPKELKEAVFRLTARPCPDAPLPGDLEGLTAALDIPVRKVRFMIPDWQRWDHGPLLCLPRQGEASVLNGTDRPENDKTSTYWRIYPEACLTRPGIAALARQVLATGRQDLLRLAALTVPVSSLSLAVPLALTVPPDRAGQALLPLLALTMAFGLLTLSQEGLLRRLTAAFEITSLALLIQRLIRTPIPALRSLPREDLAEAVFAPPRALAALGPGWGLRLLDGGTALAGTGFLAVVDPGVLAATVPALSGAVLCPLLAARISRNRFRRLLQGRRRGRRLLTDILLGQSRLRALGAEARAVTAWERQRASILADERHQDRTVALLDALETAGPWGGLMTTLALLGAMPAPATGLMVFLTLLAAIRLGRAGAELMPALVHAQPLDDLARLPLEPRLPVLPPPDAAAIQALDAADIHLSLGQVPVLRGLSIRVAPGEVVALAGASGSGKSTLLNVLLGHLLPDQGSVRIGGLPLDAVDPRLWRRHVGLVQQTDRLEVSVTLRGHLGGLSSTELPEIWRALEDVFLAEDVRRMPMGLQTITDDLRFSTGQIQRVLIARQLIRKPHVLVLDEATNAVPDTLQEALIGSFRRLGLGVLLVSHRESALALADRLVFLEKGKITFDGPPAEALARPNVQACLSAERRDDQRSRCPPFPFTAT